MATFGNVSFIDQYATSVMLNIKPHQNLVADLDDSKYNMTIYLMIECLNHSLLNKALKLFHNVLIFALSLAY